MSILLRKTLLVNRSSYALSNLRTTLRYASTDTKKYVTKIIGSGQDSRMFFFEDGVDINDTNNAISPWHDISIITDLTGNFRFVNEIPKGTRAKMEVATREPGNPIKQDEKNGKPRFFNYGNLPFNYGFIPQTYEDPTTEYPGLNLIGDNDPVDVVEVSTGALKQGEIATLKVIGAIALIDEGELDWKIIGVNAASPLAKIIDKPDDLESVLPGIESTIREWFRMYKVPDGKPVNEFAFDEKILSKQEALKIINETHNAWKRLLLGEIPANGLYTKNNSN